MSLCQDTVSMDFGAQQQHQQNGLKEVASRRKQRKDGHYHLQPLDFVHMERAEVFQKVSSLLEKETWRRNSQGVLIVLDPQSATL